MAEGETQNDYRWCGGRGYRLSPHPSPWVMKNLGFLAEATPATAVDVGFYEGRHLGVLGSLVGAGRLIGTDIHSSTVAVFAQEVNATLVETPLDRSIAVAANCEGLADAGLCHRVLHNVHGPGALHGAVAGLAALMRPGGRLLVSVRRNRGVTAQRGRPGIIRRITRTPDGETCRTDLYFSPEGLRTLFRPYFEISFVDSFLEEESYLRENERVDVFNLYLGMGVIRRG